MWQLKLMWKVVGSHRVGTFVFDASIGKCYSGTRCCPSLSENLFLVLLEHVEWQAIVVPGGWLTIKKNNTVKTYRAPYVTKRIKGCSTLWIRIIIIITRRLTCMSKVVARTIYSHEKELLNENVYIEFHRMRNFPLWYDVYILGSKWVREFIYGT